MKFSRGALAATLASVVMTVAPSLAQSFRPVSNILPEIKEPQITQPKEAPESVLRQARTYSLTHEEVAICIYKGKKDNISGEKIGETLAAILKKNFNIPTKVFIDDGSDYTVVAFFVAGHAYGGYGLKDSIEGAALAAGGWDDVFGTGRRREPMSGVLGKPAPER
jgi:hypothetical protein